MSAGAEHGSTTGTGYSTTQLKTQAAVGGDGDGCCSYVRNVRAPRSTPLYAQFWVWSLLTVSNLFFFLLLAGGGQEATGSLLRMCPAVVSAGDGQANKVCWITDPGGDMHMLTRRLAYVRGSYDMKSRF